MKSNTLKKNGVIIEVPVCTFDSESSNLSGEVVYSHQISIALLYDANSIENATALLYSKLIEWVSPAGQVCSLKPFELCHELAAYLDLNGFNYVRGNCSHKFFRQHNSNMDDDYEDEFYENGAICGFSFPRICQQLSAKALDLYTDKEALQGCLAPFAVLDATENKSTIIPTNLINEAQKLLPELMGEWKFN